jgi:hypothetical protein
VGRQGLFCRRFLRPCQGRLARCGETRIHCPVNGL